MDLFKTVSVRCMLTMLFINMGVLVNPSNVEAEEKRERSIDFSNSKCIEEKEAKKLLSRNEAIEKLATHILDFEGGYSNHELDYPTNKGIQWQTYKAFAKRLKLDTSRVAFRAMNNTQAKKFIYLFWQLANVDSIKDKRIAAFFVEEFWAAPISIKFYQQKLNESYCLGLAEDGGMGTETVKAINSFQSDSIIPKLIQWKEERYERIIQRNPKKAIFKKGWRMRRIEFNVLFLSTNN